MEFDESGNIKFPVKAAFFETLGYLASPSRMTKLDAEMPFTSQTSFEKKYQGLTGLTPKPDDTNYFILHSGADKWGVELRVYFVSNGNIPSNLQKKIVKVRPGMMQNSRINDNNLILDLIRYGFRLSDSQDLNLIKSKVPQVYVPDFEKGLSI